MVVHLECFTILLLGFIIFTLFQSQFIAVPQFFVRGEGAGGALLVMSQNNNYMGFENDMVWLASKPRKLHEDDVYFPCKPGICSFAEHKKSSCPDKECVCYFLVGECVDPEEYGLDYTMEEENSDLDHSMGKSTTEEENSGLDYSMEEDLDSIYTSEDNSDLVNDITDYSNLDSTTEEDYSDLDSTTEEEDKTSEENYSDQDNRIGDDGYFKCKPGECNFLNTDSCPDKECVCFPGMKECADPAKYGEDIHMFYV